jgi:site-specific recombinase XerD
MVVPSEQCTLDVVAERFITNLGNPITRAMYGKAIRDFLAWYGGRPIEAVTREVLETYRFQLTELKYSSSTVNQRLSAIRKFLLHAGDEGLISPATALIATRVSGVRKREVRVGRWLSPQQAEELVNAPDPLSPKGLRDRAILALLIGCGLRRAEVVSLETGHLERLEGRGVLLDIEGKHRRIRTVPVPPWVKSALDDWVETAQIKRGRLFRAVERRGTVTGRPICAQTVLDIVVQQGKVIGLSIRPNDLRRTCAKLCRREGGDLEQIQLLLGHSSVQITESYLGTRRCLAEAPNERIPIRWHGDRRELAS